jgi:hypothetical protein
VSVLSQKFYLQDEDIMLNKFMITTFTVLGLSVCLNVQADNLDTCFVQVAVATPPVQLDVNVAFNVGSDYGISKSLTLKGGSAPETIDKLPCSPNPFTISATRYSTPSNDSFYMLPPIGQCSLKAGLVFLSGDANSATFVFPYDFNCPS